MNICLNNIKRIFNNKIRFFLLFIGPVLFILTFVGDSTVTIKVGIVDNDTTKVTEAFIDDLSDIYDVTIVNEESIIDNIINYSVDYVLVFEEGFTNSIIKDDTLKIRQYDITEMDISQPAKMYIENYINGLLRIAEAANHDEENFYKGYNDFTTDSLVVNKKIFDESDKLKTIASLGFLIQFMLYMSVITAAIILEDKSNHTFNRVFYAPVRVKRYMFENLISFYIVAVGQVTGMFLILKFVMGMDFAGAWFKVLLLFLLFAGVCVSLGLFIISISKNVMQAYVIILLITSPLTMLGGCYWPRDMMNDTLIKISNFMPTTWALNGATKLIKGETIGIEIIVLLAFATVFFLLGSLRKQDIVK